MLICLSFVFFFSLTPPNWHTIADFNFHFEKLKGCENHFDKPACEIYAPLLHIVSFAFGFTKVAFLRWLFFLLLFVTPMVLFFYTKKWVTVWLYFSTTQYLYLIDGGAAYPQMLAGIFFIIFLNDKRFWVKIICSILAILAHGQAFYLIILAWVISLLLEVIKDIKEKNVLWACSAIIPEQLRSFSQEKITVQIIQTTGNIAQQHLLIKDVLNLFARMFVLPFMLASLWQAKKEKRFDLLVLFAIMLYFGATTQPRMFLFVPIMFLPLLTNFYLNLKPAYKKYFLVLTIISFFWEFGTWINYKLSCI